MLSSADLDQLARAGIAAAEAGRQLAQLSHPPPPVRLLRPATVGDGIERLDAAERLAAAAAGAAARDAGRLRKFVPASGAATRMFRALTGVRARYPDATPAALEHAAAAGDGEARESVDILAALPRLALGLRVAELYPGLDFPSRQQSIEPLLACLLDADGLDAVRLPKALLPFHRTARGARTALVEQLVEGLGYLEDRLGVARFHFTIPPGSRARFELEVEQASSEIGAACRLEVDFSEQARATDTLALDEQGAPFRTEAGELLLRPAGHGALLANLAACGGDLVLVKNIDNVLPERWHAEIAHWQLVLVGLLVELEAVPTQPERPRRVCAVVPNTGEPGGGPFWVADERGGESLQIVESSQIDGSDAAQLAIWRASTHFNPVDLAVALRDGAGRPFELASFVDLATAFVSSKSEGGRRLRVLERPGLWNGAMARWQSRFVELPGWTFAPVKSVADLARPEHASEP